MEKLMRLIEEERIDPTVIISHRTADLGDGPNLYKPFRAKEDGCVKVVMFPHGTSSEKTMGHEERQKQMV